ncbi:23S rRNA (uracil(1939)-C(5))-methyltransferase RlmD [Candidatus Caldatribacterium sp.]|uniref:23S rRNA (uracil(1939)-C(5))-methyltransferase RlmD n=1 Tax=Candidatus Caldatribacterium sp. TaxID=2282143 RepID=UPI00299647F1|nr:23S rRNA (uracil(1939)-C(5))-methyltransferase RlmD [Candidatus Caldatribacterium sp.]MDW8080314.1 23S rRNA (uracil(1939)-C(5))-methyltransferase RlmD [Candidatus Calescibacterium sp.]
MVHKGEILEGSVVDFALPDCHGVLKKDGFVIFVPLVLREEVCRVEIAKVKRDFALGRVLEILEESPYRIAPPCPHFREGCGGCQLQFVAYGEQVRLKREHALSVLERIGRVDLSEVLLEDFVASPQPFAYRNKMEFTFGEKDGELLLGLRPANRYWDVVNLTTCLLMRKDLVERLLDLFREYGKRHGIPGYDPVRKTGILRNLLVRYSGTTGDLLVGLATTSFELPEMDHLVEVLCEGFPELRGFVHIVNNSPASALLFEEKRVLWGEPYLFERIGNLTFRVSAESFFQVHSTLCGALYEKVREYLLVDGPVSTVLDLYCGGGGIGIFVADAVEKVVGIEENPKAVEDASDNARRNNRLNFTCVPGRVEKLLAASRFRVDAVIVDPPRAGLDKKVVQRITALLPRTVVYVSCNIGTFARDVALFRERGYKLCRISFFDLFPQTPHFETVALLVQS